MTPEERLIALYGAAVDALGCVVTESINATEAAIASGVRPDPKARHTVLRLRLATALIRECIAGEPVRASGHTTMQDIAALLEAELAPIVLWGGQRVGHAVVIDAFPLVGEGNRICSLSISGVVAVPAVPGLSRKGSGGTITSRRPGDPPGPEMPLAPTLPPKRQPDANDCERAPRVVCEHGLTEAAERLLWPPPERCQGDPRYQPISPAYPFADMQFEPWPVGTWTSQLAGVTWGLCASCPEMEMEVCDG